ncbi:MAG TPA: hypothetical protein VL221_09945 [Bacteroidota bacterium]|nr:hypothetical protein [Bacteroidota bacterium]
MLRSDLDTAIEAAQILREYCRRKTIPMIQVDRISLRTKDIVDFYNPDSLVGMVNVGTKDVRVL